MTGQQIEPTENVHTALLAFQAEAPALQKTKINPGFKGAKYAPLEHVMAEVMPVLNRHGLVWTTLPDHLDGEPALSYRLVHATTGTFIAGAMLLRSKGATPQDQGSAITYARRYSMMAVLGLTANEDDDGRRASRATPSARRPRTAPATLAALATAAAGLRASKIKLAFAGAGIPYDSAAIFDHLTSAQAEVLIPALEGMER